MLHTRDKLYTLSASNKSLGTWLGNMVWKINKNFGNSIRAGVYHTKITRKKDTAIRTFIKIPFYEGQHFGLED